MNAHSSIEPPVVKPPAKTVKRWCSAEVTRIFKVDDYRVDLCFEFTPNSKRNEGSTFLGTLFDGPLNHVVELPHFGLVGFLASVGFVSVVSPQVLLGPRSPLVGFKFDVLIDLEYVGESCKPAHSARSQIIALAERLGNSLNAAHDNAILSAAANATNGPIYYESASFQDFEDAGFDLAGPVNHELRPMKGKKDITWYEAREALFAGYRSNGPHMVKRTGPRSTILLTVRNKNADRRPRLEKFQPVEGNLTTFIVSRQAGGLQIFTPLWEGKPFWCLDETDADVAQIIAECNRIKKHRNSGTPADNNME